MTSKEANQEVEIARCHRGQYFGELALVTNKPRAASAYAVGEVKCLGKQMFCISSFWSLLVLWTMPEWAAIQN